MMPDELRDKLLIQWYEQFSADHEHQKRSMIDRLPGTGSEADHRAPRATEGELSSWYEAWYEQFSRDHEDQKHALVSQLANRSLEHDTSGSDDADLWYLQFEAGHDALREDLLSRLPTRDTPPGGQEEIPLEHEHQDDASLDNAICEWYQQFEGGTHDAKRQELLDSLPVRERPTDAGTTRQRLVSNRWLQLAASLLFLTTAGLILSSLSARPAYALEEVFAKLRTAKRVYIVGTSYSAYEEDKSPPLKVEVFIERPNRFWALTSGRGYGKDRQLIELSTGYYASNGTTRQKKAYQQDENYAPSDGWEDLTQNDYPVWSQIQAERMLQDTVGSVFFEGVADDFEFKEKTSYNGVSCDVFEQRTYGSVRRVFVSSEHFVPVYASWAVIIRGKELLRGELHTFEIDPVSVPNHIRFPDSDAEAVAAPKLVDRFKRSKLSPFGSDAKEVHIPFALRSETGVVTCWGTRERPEFAASGPVTVTDPTFSFVNPAGESVPSEVVELGTTFDGETTWHWVHVLPKSTARSRRIMWQYSWQDRSEDIDLQKDISPVDVGPEGIRAAIESAANDEASVDAIWRQLQESEQVTLDVPQA